MSATENVLSLDAVNRTGAHNDRRIGQILAEEGQIGQADIERVIALHLAEGVRVGEAAVRLGLIEEGDVDRALAMQYRIAHRLARREEISAELSVAIDSFHPSAEAFRALRTRLLIGWANSGADRRVLAIVSPGSQEGRSHVAANLAVAFAQIGERTLLIDADLRNPRQHLIFNIPDRVGLGAVLAGRAGIDAVVSVPQFGTLSLLPAGPNLPNPQELLSQPAFTALLRDWRSEFDVILIDTPPAMRFADAQLIAYRAGSAIVLARRNHSRLIDAQHVIRDLGAMGTRIFGSMLSVF